MARHSALAKKSIVVDPKALRQWVKASGSRTESQAVRAAIVEVLAIRAMQDAVRELQSRGTFGKNLR